MGTGEKRPQSRPQSGPQAGSSGVAPDEVDAGLPPGGITRSVTEAEPAWLERFVWSLLLKFVAASLATALLLLLARELRHLLWLLVVSGKRHEVVYQSPHGDVGPETDTAPPT